MTVNHRCYILPNYIRITLIELLVVIAIIAISFRDPVPVLPQVRKSSVHSCASNLSN